MVSTKVKSKPNRVIRIILLPALIFIGAAGWLMYAVGDNHKANPHKPTKPTQKNNVTLLPIILENQQEIRMHNSTSSN